MEIQKVGINTLVEDPHNARLHPTQNLEAIKESLAKFGQVEPLIVRSGAGVVIGGNGRLRAMRDLGWSEVNVVEVEVNDEQAMSLGLALNRAGDLAEWDQQKLDGLLATIYVQAEGDLDLTKLGFKEEDLNALVGPPEDLSSFQKDPLDNVALPVQGPAKAVGDGSWFYIEYYGEDERFSRLKERLGKAMRNAHEVEPDIFEKMVETWCAQQ